MITNVLPELGRGRERGGEIRGREERKGER